MEIGVTFFGSKISPYRGNNNKGQKKKKTYTRSKNTCFDEPAEGTFGHYMWLILGGTDNDASLAAKRLGKPKGTLAALISGKQIPTRHYVKKFKLIERLKQFNPRAFERHKTGLISCYRALEDGRPKSERAPKPIKQGSALETFYDIIGGKDARFLSVAKRLDFSLKQLRDIVLWGDTKLTLVNYRRWNFGNNLRIRFPEAERDGRIGLLEARLLEEEGQKGEEQAKPPASCEEIKRQVAEALEKILDQNGSSVEILAQAMEKEGLDEKTLGRILRGDSGIDEALYRKAATEVVQACFLAPDDPSAIRTSLLVERLNGRPVPT